jgi:hypothetical protein
MYRAPVTVSGVELSHALLQLQLLSAIGLLKRTPHFRFTRGDLNRTGDWIRLDYHGRQKFQRNDLRCRGSSRHRWFARD